MTSSLSQAGTEPKTAQMPLAGSPVPRLVVPHCDRAGSASYRSLSHCQRNNVFPGAPVTCRSLSQDSYTAHPPSAPTSDPDHWHGHKTDDMVEWMERNFVNLKVNKMWAEMEKRRVPK